MNLETLTKKIETLSNEVDSDTKKVLPSIVIKSGVIEQCVDLAIAGEDLAPTMQAFFQRLEEEYLDEYEAVGNLAELLAMSKVDAIRKGK